MSITLAAGQVQTVTIGGVTTETDSQGAAQAMHVNLNGPDITVTLAKGTVSGNVLNEGTQTRVTVTINGVTGFWQSSNGLSGTLAGAALTNVQTMAKGWRNTIETFAVNNNIMPGTQVPWA